MNSIKTSLKEEIPSSNSEFIYCKSKILYEVKYKEFYLYKQKLKMKQLVECVPNISEGRDPEKIKIISQIVEEIDGVKLLNVDPESANK